MLQARSIDDTTPENKQLPDEEKPYVDSPFVKVGHKNELHYTVGKPS
jgi:hypothetical protein